MIPYLISLRYEVCHVGTVNLFLKQINKVELVLDLRLFCQSTVTQIH